LNVIVVPQGSPATTSPDYAAYGGGCHGDPGMNVDVADNLNISMTLRGTNWIQTVTYTRSGQSVTYTIDMMGKVQEIADVRHRGVFANAAVKPF
jgi:predicted MarR family transcription regulator